jgi:hypothetical protein
VQSSFLEKEWDTAHAIIVLHVLQLVESERLLALYDILYSVFTSVLPYSISALAAAMKLDTVL